MNKEFKTVGDLLDILATLPLSTQIITCDADRGGYDVTYHIGGVAERVADIFDDDHHLAQAIPRVLGEDVVFLLGSGDEMFSHVPPFKDAKKRCTCHE